MARGHLDRLWNDAKKPHSARAAAESEGRSLVLAGKPGRGRTHIAVAIAFRAIQKGFEALFVKAAELIDELSAWFREGRLPGSSGSRLERLDRVGTRRSHQCRTPNRIKNRRPHHLVTLEGTTATNRARNRSPAECASNAILESGRPGIPGTKSGTRLDTVNGDPHRLNDVAPSPGSDCVFFRAADTQQ